MTIQSHSYIHSTQGRALYRILRVFPSGLFDALNLGINKLEHITRPEYYKTLRGEPMKLKLSYDDALAQAQELTRALAPACARLQIAGSLRRQCTYIGDIELVAIPHYDPLTNLFSEVYGQQSRLDFALDRLVAAGRLVPGDKQGDRYKKFIVPPYDVQLDLFITNLDSWGVIFTQRTGSADFARWLFTPQAQGGALPGNMRCRDRRLWRHGGRLTTPDEQDVFTELGVPWIAPKHREKGLWK
jgi:DNA polymerase/3'-5' exonuclease PolX